MRKFPSESSLAEGPGALYDVKLEKKFRVHANLKKERKRHANNISIKPKPPSHINKFDIQQSLTISIENKCHDQKRKEGQIPKEQSIR